MMDFFVDLQGVEVLPVGICWECGFETVKRDCTAEGRRKKNF